jgi:hypothetical protein
MATTGRKLGFGAMGVGLLLSAVGVLSGGASADGPVAPEPLVCENSVTVNWTEADMEAIASDAGRVFSNGAVSVTISNGTPVFPDAELNIYDVGSVDFVSNKPIDIIQVKLWSEDVPGNISYRTDTFDPAITSGTLTGSGEAEINLVRIKGIVFCAEAEAQVIPTVVESTSTTTTSTTTTTTVATAPNNITGGGGPAAEVGGVVQVLPQTVTAPQLAFTGNDSAPMVFGGGALVLVGLALVGIDRVGVVRRGRHSR